ncbi:LptF/LptG family permease [uncultured Algibacter sp.]|uniref:LptF/LptG family permease n=1 Tax=uncultured Algibacter sp. TaxID=298659 RepID=UPI0032174887
MKILDRYILTSYLKTFISVFVILMLIFILQTIWLYIKELAGKELDIMVIVKFLVYFMPKLIPLVLPLTILLSSIMVFGSFAENYEFAAMKSTGISLQRAMSGLSVFIVTLGIITFFFSNNVIPWAELNSLNLRRNIAKLKPAMYIAEGQFNEIGNYNIKVQHKSGERGQYLEDVTIHLKGKNGSKNTTVIKSKTGELASEKNSDVLKLILFDGHYYQDVTRNKLKDRKKKQFAKSSFEKKIINIDLSQLNNVDFDEQSLTDKYNMLDVSGLSKTIDSLVKKQETNQESFSKSLHVRSGLSIKKADKTKKTTNKDSIYRGDLLDVFDTKTKYDIADVTLRSITSSNKIITSKKATLKTSKSWLNRHFISFHEKFALGFACIILFFVGAPLGALIRKGGIGLPLVIAIVLFLTYHFIGIFAVNSAKSGNFNPVLASWFSTLVMLPLGIFLTKRATADKGLFESESLLEPLKKLLGIKKKALDEDISTFSSESPEYGTLEAYNENKIIDIIKNYRQYGYSLKYRNTALSIMNSRGISNQQLKFAGNFANTKLEEAIRLKNKFEEDSLLAFIIYIIFALFTVVSRVLENNGFELIGNILLGIGILFGIIFLISLIKSFMSSSNFYKHIGKESIANSIIFLLVGLPLYVLIFFFQKRKMDEELFLTVNPESGVKPNNTKPLEASEDYKKLIPIAKNYKDHSKFAIVLYSIGIILLILFFVFKNNKLMPLALASIQLSAVALILYIIYYVKSIVNVFQFYKQLNQKKSNPNIFIFILGLPFYMITYIFLNKKIKEDLALNY